jgi:hypothetical protein
MSGRSSTSRRASQTRSSVASNRYIRGEDVNAAVMGVDRLNVNEVDAATSTRAGLERCEHPGEDPAGGGKGGCGFGIKPWSPDKPIGVMSAFALEADASACPGDVGFVPIPDIDSSRDYSPIVIRSLIGLAASMRRSAHWSSLEATA